MPGFGHTGRDATRIGFGPTIEQMGGLVALQGYEGGPPHRSGISYGDPISGTIAAGAVAMLLFNRERTGEGGYAVIAQRDSICSLIGEFVIGEALGHPLPLRIGSHDAEWAPQNVYRAADTEPRLSGRPGIEFTDSWVAISIDSEAAWAAFKKLVGDARLEDTAFDTQAGRYAAQDQIDAIITEWTSTRDATEVATELQAAGIAAAPVLTPLMVTKDAHLEARGFFVPYSHPDTGPGRAASPAWRWKRRPHRPLRSAPRFGEHSDDVLARVGGYSEDELRSFAVQQITTSDIIPGAAG
jgi:crotonobetainyl-CoA:carnitine CoA-transferase CaiB-like acyl-CoA transferase